MRKSNNNMASLLKSKSEEDITLEEAAQYLDQAGVPKGLKWRVLLLYMRSLSDYNYLDDEQKYQIQKLLLDLLKEKDFNEQAYHSILEKKGEILFKPYKQKLRQAYTEISNLLQTFQNLYMNRKGDVQGLEDETIQLLEDEEDFENALPKIRNSFQQVIQGMEKDVKDLYRQTRIDSLTSLYNRKAYEELLDQFIFQAIRDDKKLSLAMLDIDHFKNINDEYGHRIGDQALATVAKIIREFAEEVSEEEEKAFFAARYGGEEFTIILPDNSFEEAYQLVETIRSRVEKYSFVIRNSQGQILHSGIRLTISAGIAEFVPMDIDDPGSWLTDKADKAMYRAKNQGRNQIAF